MPFLFLLDAAREHDMGGQCCHVAPIRCASLDYVEKLRGKYNGRVYVCAWTRIVLDIRYSVHQYTGIASHRSCGCYYHQRDLKRVCRILPLRPSR